MPDNWIGHIKLTSETEVLDAKGEKIHDLIPCDQGAGVEVDKASYPVLWDKLTNGVMESSIIWEPIDASDSAELVLSSAPTPGSSMVVSAESSTTYSSDGVDTTGGSLKYSFASRSLEDYSILYSFKESRDPNYAVVEVTDSTSTGAQVPKLFVTGNGQGQNDRLVTINFIGSNTTSDPLNIVYSGGTGSSDIIVCFGYDSSINKYWGFVVVEGVVYEATKTPLYARYTIYDGIALGVSLFEGTRSGTFKKLAMFPRVVTVSEVVEQTYTSKILPNMAAPIGSPHPYKIVADKT